MRKTRISETMQNIDQKYVDEATEYKNNKKATPRKVWHKWIAVAACFAVALVIGIPVISDLFVSPDHKDMLKDNIKTLRKTKGLSQEDLAIKLNRQSANSTRS